MRWHLVGVLAMAVVAFSHPAPAAESLSVRWDDLVRAADQHPRLAAGRFQVDAARGGVDAARAVPNPTVDVSVGEGLSRTGGASRAEWGLALTLPLGWVAGRGYRADAAEAGVDVALAESRALRREVLAQLRTLFWTLAYEQARVASLGALLDQTEALAQTVSRRVEKGEARPVEATRVAIEREKVASELEAARTSLAARQAGLALWLDGAPQRLPVAVADLEGLPTPLDRDAALERAKRTDPALDVARARIRALEAEVGVESRARVPSVALTGFANDELDRRSFGLGVALDLPLWDWSSGRIAEARARLAAGRQQAEAARLEIEVAIVETQAACQASVATATRFRDHVLPRSEAAASTTEKTYQLGEASLLEVIDARRTLLDARRSFLGALAEAQLSCSRLDLLVGEEPR